jgi:hypothetical protein
VRREEGGEQDEGRRRLTVLTRKQGKSITAREVVAKEKGSETKRSRKGEVENSHSKSKVR